MNLTAQIAKHFREVHFGGNWTWSNLKDNLADVTWQQAITPVYDLNTIAVLTFHVNYFVCAALDVLEGRPLTSNDKYSFDHPPVQCAEDWEKLRDKALSDAEKLAGLIEQLPEHKLWEDFTDKKYGNYCRNIFGIIEHTHYHLGQIAVVKKILQQQETKI
ncbi:MAG: hypothetical protein FD123_955 [Bacteroidetes bacterium]|nr:MAG: hypothetical protein FD123_955 [Bacteroidota bacterium]